MSSSQPDYRAAEVPVRTDLRETHARLLDYVGQPGPWLSGAERIALAVESRNAAGCPLCLERKRSLSPEQPSGEHARASDLPEPLVELAHRVRGDPQRLSRAWMQRTLERGVSEGAYVEAVGIVTFTAGIDYFCRALGIPPFELPDAQQGGPDGYVPDGLRSGQAWVSMLAPEDATGAEASLYGGAAFVPNIVRALSQVPDHARHLQAEMRSHYVSLEQLADPSARRDLDRLQIELVAARVSALNECFY
jgi:alkylhydroperoxidase family enzyme